MTGNKIMRPALVAGLILAAGASLTACQKKAGSDATGFAAFKTGAPRTEDKFGKGFGRAFRAPANSVPANIADGDVIPVSLTTEPVQIE